MVSDRLSDRMDRVSGKAREWAGRAAGNVRVQRQGRRQSTLAGVRIRVRDAVSKLMVVFRQQRRRR